MCGEGVLFGNSFSSLLQFWAQFLHGILILFGFPSRSSVSSSDRFVRALGHKEKRGMSFIRHRVTVLMWESSLPGKKCGHQSIDEFGKL